MKAKLSLDTPRMPPPRKPPRTALGLGDTDPYKILWQQIKEYLSRQTNGN